MCRTQKKIRIMMSPTTEQKWRRNLWFHLSQDNAAQQRLTPIVHFVVKWMATDQLFTETLAFDSNAMTTMKNIKYKKMVIWVTDGLKEAHAVEIGCIVQREVTRTIIIILHFVIHDRPNHNNNWTIISGVTMAGSSFDCWFACHDYNDKLTVELDLASRWTRSIEEKL